MKVGIRIIKSIKKNLWKIILLIVVLMIVYVTFMDSLPLIMKEITETDPCKFLIVCILSFFYCVIEGVNMTSFARKYQEDFRIWNGLLIFLYGCFYKVVTFGSGSSVAIMYYLNKKGIKPSIGMSITTIQYVIHKLTIALLATIFLLCNYHFMMEYYAKYLPFLMIGYGLTVVIVAFLILICVSSNFHKLLLFFLNKVGRKFVGEDKIEELKEEMANLRSETKYILKDKKFVLKIIARNMVKLSCWYVIPYILMYGKIDYHITEIAMVCSLVIILSGVLPTPAGIGSIEVVYVLLYSLLVGGVLASSSMLIFRFATYIFPFILGSIAVVLFH